MRTETAAGNGVQASAAGNGVQFKELATVSNISNARFIDELESVLTRGLRLLHGARSELRILRTETTEEDELPQTSRIPKKQGWDQFARLRNPVVPPVPRQASPHLGVLSKMCDEALTNGGLDVAHDACKIDDHTSERMNTSSDYDIISYDGSSLKFESATTSMSMDDPELEIPSKHRLSELKKSLDKVGIESATSSAAPSDVRKKSILSDKSNRSTYAQRQSTASFAAGNEQQIMKGSKTSKASKAVEEFLDDPESSVSAGYFNIMVSIFIQFSVVLSLWQTVDNPPIDMDTFVFIQLSLDAFFIGELGIRLCVSSNLRMFVTNAHNIIDFIAAVLPLSTRAALFLGLADAEDEGMAKYIVFCVAPPLREMKILRRVQQFHLFGLVLRDIREAVQTLLMLLMMMVLVFSSLLYVFEPRYNISSMPTAVWMTIVTMTTVGYGDITPESTPGHIIASILALCSVLYMAMPIGIIGNAFTETWQNRDFILLMIKTRGAMLRSGYVAHDLPDIFQYYSDGSGELTLDGFTKMVKDMNLGLNPDRALKVFESIDRDGGGSIDEQEFVRSVFPSAFHDLYQTKNDSDDLEEETFAAKAVETLKGIGRQISPGFEAVQNFLKSPPRTASPRPSQTSGSGQRPPSPRPSQTSACGQKPPSPRPSQSSASGQKPPSPRPSQTSASAQKPPSPRPSQSSGSGQKPRSPHPSQSSGGGQKPPSPRPSQSSGGGLKPPSPRPSQSSAFGEQPLSPRPSQKSASL